MTAIPQSPHPTPPSDDELDLRQLAATLQRHWRLIAKVASGALVVSTVYALITPRVWKGEFQIVLAAPDSGGSRLAKLAAANPILANLAGFGGGGSGDNLETEVKVLESPSVLKPVFDFVRSSKQRAGQKTEGMRFSSWVKNVKVELEKGTSVLNISYTDTDKNLILPVIQHISREYQDYSGRDRRRDIANAVVYLKEAIADLTPKAEDSMKRAQAYALSNGLGLSDGMPASGDAGGSGGGASSVEASRQQAQAKLLVLQQQLAQARTNGNRVLFQAPQLGANAELYKQYQATEARLSDLRSRLRDNDELVRNLQRQRLSLIGTLNRQTIGLLQGELATATATLQASSRPKEVVLKHRELVRKAIRNEKTLSELENQLQIAQLEQAKQTEPWELISTPTLLDAPVAPKKSRIMAVGLLAGLVAGCGVAVVMDRRSGRVFSQDELQQLLPGPMLANLNSADGTSFDSQLTLLARGPLAGSQRVGLIPVGLPSDGPQLLQLLSDLRQRMPRTELHCDHNLVSADNCDHQLLITSLGAPTRRQLASLSQQLQLQGRPITGWLLLDETSVA
jgi:succinoglycan biosynthesis transport protein ExoP